MNSLIENQQLWFICRKYGDLRSCLLFTRVGFETTRPFFMQSLYAHSIGKMLSKDSFSWRLGGFYCLYCLYETHPFKPPFRIYLSLGIPSREFHSLKRLVVDAKKQEIFAVPALVKKMLDKNTFLFGFVEINESSVNGY
ncbi:hypothetical protein MKX03_029389 [Papaver bracteatum]|nr:hypothetical protein MKX03_029389 [Papaver bracteatum]